MGTDCKSAAFSFGGSNPPAPTKDSSIRTGYWSFCFICLEKGDARVDSNSCGAVAEDSAKTAQWAVFSSAARAIHPRPPRTPVSEPGTGVSVLSVLQKGLQGWIRTASTRRIVRRGKAPVQQRRPLPAAETGRSCWGCGQQDARAAQGTTQPLGAATRVPFLRGSRHLPAHILHLSLTCDTIQVTETTQTEDFFHDLRYPEQPAQLSGRKR